MEQRLNKQIEQYITEFKENIKRKLFEMEIMNIHKANEFMEYVYDYDRLVVSKDDFVKRKRTQKEIPVIERCNASRSTGEQCTRRRKKNAEYCGTHCQKMTETDGTQPANLTHDIEVFTEEINGIVYYIDKQNNVYKTEDILQNIQNPKIIAKSSKEDNKYKILEFIT